MVTFDKAKEVINLRKHGISLRRADDFDHDTAQYLPDDREDYGEQRFRAIGFLDALLHTLIFTAGEDDELRAISLRRSTKQEQREYANQKER